MLPVGVNPPGSTVVPVVPAELVVPPVEIVPSDVLMLPPVVPVIPPELVAPPVLSLVPPLPPPHPAAHTATTKMDSKVSFTKTAHTRFDMGPPVVDIGVADALSTTPASVSEETSSPQTHLSLGGAAIEEHEG
jgi:hypothetical protein